MTVRPARLPASQGTGGSMAAGASEGNGEGHFYFILKFNQFDGVHTGRERSARNDSLCQETQRALAGDEAYVLLASAGRGWIHGTLGS